jgi:hypothetical protein
MEVKHIYSIKTIKKKGKRRQLLLNFIDFMLMYFCYTSLAYPVYSLNLCSKIKVFDLEMISK